MIRARFAIGGIVLLLSLVAHSGAQQERPQQCPPNPQAAATVTRDQADAILSELRQIRRLLEANPRPTVAPAGSPQPPRSVRMPVVPGWRAMGREDAPLTLIEFADYQCPYCRRFQTDTFPELKKQYIDTGKLRFVVRDMPLPFHPNALTAAQAARCAGEQSKFWELRESLILHADDLGLESILRYGEAAGADAKQLRTCIESEKYKTAIQKDASEAAALSLRGTPAFVLAKTAPQELNGEVILGALPLPAFEAAMKRLSDPATPTKHEP